jgi:hypothetical protein
MIFASMLTPLAKVVEESFVASWLYIVVLVAIITAANLIIYFFTWGIDASHNNHREVKRAEKEAG